MKTVFNVPVNSVSFGFVSTAILREIYRQNIPARLFPISQVDLSAQPSDPGFESWIQESQQRAWTEHSREDTVVKLWHINGLLESYSQNQIAITFLETDSVTPVERQILLNQKTVFVTSGYTKRIFEEFGLRNVKYLDLGFDKDNFYPTGKDYLGKDVIVFYLGGKLENRKRTLKALQCWAKRFGNDKKYRLHCNIFNPFLKQEDQIAMISQALEGKNYWNITLAGWMKTNAEVNDLLNSAQIVLGLSGGEGRDLMTFHGIGLGKHAIVLDAHAYKDYTTNENSVLLPPCGKIPAADGIFFHQNNAFNQGSFFDWNEKDLNNAFDEVLQRYGKNPVNTEGLKLQDKTYSQTLDSILLEL